MRNWILSAIVLSALLLCNSTSWAEKEPLCRLASVDHVPADAIPPGVATFQSTMELVEESFSQEASDRLALPASSFSSNALLLDGEPAGRGGARYLPVLYSLILPGAGEIALGHYWRGAALIAVEATAWTGYAVYRDRGLDGRGEFEAFADAHWDFDRWIRDHNATAAIGGDPNVVTFEELDAYGQSDQWNSFPGWHSYASRENDKQNYYENIGKYDWFISGWDDWVATGKGEDTAVRDEYRALRKKSNDDLNTSDRFIYLSIAARVFSLVETVLMVRSQDDAVRGGTVDERNYRITARSTGRHSGELAFEYRFR